MRDSAVWVVDGIEGIPRAPMTRITGSLHVHGLTNTTVLQHLLHTLVAVDGNISITECTAGETGGALVLHKLAAVGGSFTYRAANVESDFVSIQTPVLVCFFTPHLLALPAQRLAFCLRSIGLHCVRLPFTRARSC